MTVAAIAIVAAFFGLFLATFRLMNSGPRSAHRVLTTRHDLDAALIDSLVRLGLRGASGLDSLARLSAATGDYATSEALYQHSLTIQEKALGTHHPEVARTLENLAALYEAQGRQDEGAVLRPRAELIREAERRRAEMIQAAERTRRQREVEDTGRWHWQGDFRIPDDELSRQGYDSTGHQWARSREPGSIPPATSEPFPEHPRPPAPTPVAPSPANLRNTQVTCPSLVETDEWFELRVRVTSAARTLPNGETVVQAPASPHDIQFAIQPPPDSAAEQAIDIDVKVYGANCVVEEPTRRSLSVPVAGDSEPLFFRLKCRWLGRQEISVYFYQDARYLGEVVVETVAAAAAPNAPVARRASVHGAAREASVDHAKSASIRLSPGARSPDLQIHIYSAEAEANGTRLKFDLQSPSRALDIGYDTDIVTARGSTPAAWARRAMEEMEAALQDGDAIRMRAHVTSVGRTVYEQFFPDRLKALLEHQPSIETILILSEEPDIPWETAFLDDPNDPNGGQFLCERFAVTRWLVGSGEAPQSIELGRVAMLGVGDDPALASSVRAEMAVVSQLSGRGARVTTLEPRFQPLLNALHDKHVAVYHFACHGRFDDEFSEITLSDGVFKALYLSDPACLKTATRPFVFMNACQTGRLGNSLGGMAGWTTGFLHAGAAVFVGPVWSVETDAACRFAELLYEGLSEGRPLGETIRRARLSTHGAAGEAGGAADPAFSWLAYTVYGDPNARLTRR